MGRWRGMANMYESMARTTATSEKDVIPRSTFYRLVAGIYRTHGSELEEIYR